MITNLHQASTSLHSGTVPYPIHQFASYVNLKPHYASFLTATAQTNIPHTFKQAAYDSNWLAAMKLELNALKNNHTWEIIPKPPDKHIVDCKWLFKVKYLPNGCIERYNARLVSRGFNQTYGLDYFETYAPVAKMTTIRVLIVIAVYQN